MSNSEFRTRERRNGTKYQYPVSGFRDSYIPKDLTVFRYKSDDIKSENYPRFEPWQMGVMLRLAKEGFDDQRELGLLFEGDVNNPTIKQDLPDDWSSSVPWIPGSSTNIWMTYGFPKIGEDDYKYRGGIGSFHTHWYYDPKIDAVLSRGDMRSRPEDKLKGIGTVDNDTGFPLVAIFTNSESDKKIFYPEKMYVYFSSTSIPIERDVEEYYKKLWDTGRDW